MFLFTEEAGFFLLISSNPPTACSLTAVVLVCVGVLLPRIGFPFHIGSGPNGVFGVELLQLLEKHISELVRFLFVESGQQFLPLALSKLMTEIVELIASQEVLLLDLLQCNMELLDFQDQ